jgi:hypothetical protein
MSFQPKQKNNNSTLSQGQVDDGASVSFDETTHSSQLETILGRINAIMTDGTSVGASKEQAQQSNGRQDNSQLNAQTTNSVISGEQSSLKVQAPDNADLSAVNGQEQFQSSEPLDMLQPYSEVLNEVRDYFNERHSLDPNDRLSNTQRSQSISEEVLGAAPSNGQEIKKAKQVLLWGDAPLEASQSKEPLATSNGNESLTPGTQVKDMVTPADFGFGQSDEASSFEVGEKSSEVSGHVVDDPSQIFSPIKFENPFDRSQNAVDVLGPQDHSGQFKELRHELVDRIAQLEQVIGHHFGDRKEIANEAAQAAMKLALNNLDDTSLGRRLADIEAAFVLYQKNQAQKNQETKASIESLGKALKQMESVSQLGDQTRDLPKLTQEKIAPARPPKQPPLQNQEGRSVGKPVDAESNAASKSDLPFPKITVSKVAQSKNAEPKDTLGQRATGDTKQEDTTSKASNYRVDEIQVPKGTPSKEETGSEQKDHKPSSSSELQGVSVSEKLAQPSSQPMQTEGEGADAIEKLRQAMNSSASDRSFGKSQPIDEPDVTTDKMSAIQPEAGPIVSGDDFLAKSASLRDQFNNSDFVSNDSDLERVQPRGLKLIIGIIVVTLLLAATGIAYRDNVKGFQTTLLKIVTTIKGVAGQVGIGQGDKTVSSDGSKSEVENPNKKDQLLKENKSNDRLGSLNQGKKNTNNGSVQDPDITGNITASKQGKESDVIDLTNLGGGETLGMPPALIGPYSLRIAAARGDVRAGYEVARRFSYGLGVPKDPEQAIKWYMQGASKGFAPSQYRLATYYERGRGVEKNLGRAKVWYQRAAMLGNVKAMHNLAVISTTLEREDTDYKTAIYWFKHAANRNLADSQFNLAILYQNGVGLEKNLVSSYKWFSLAARQGDIDAAARRDKIEKKLKKEELLLASQLLQKWKPLAIDGQANDVGRISTHLTSTMSHADETISRSRTLTAQILLRKLGYVLSNADGSMNEETIRAVKKFEKDRGLPITGKINPELIQALNKASL